MDRVSVLTGGLGCPERSDRGSSLSAPRSVGPPVLRPCAARQSPCWRCVGSSGTSRRAWRRLGTLGHRRQQSRRWPGASASHCRRGANNPIRVIACAHSYTGPPSRAPNSGLVFGGSEPLSPEVGFCGLVRSIVGQRRASAWRVGGRAPGHISHPRSASSSATATTHIHAASSGSTSPAARKRNVFSRSRRPST